MDLIQKLVKISPKAHIITDEHIEEDKQKYNKVLGTTAKGIGTCYSDKYARKGIRIQDRKEEFKEYIWDEKLFGKVLCEGAQGFWLDIDYGNYPYVTSSSCLPHSACTLGFAPQKIRKIFGAVKMYDTRVGKDPDFPDDLLCNQELMTLAHEGNEYGTTTNRARLVNYLNLNKLISAIEISGTTELIISKVDIVEKAHIFRYYYQDILHTVDTLQQMKDNIQEILYSNTSLLKNIIFSSNPEKI